MLFWPLPPVPDADRFSRPAISQQLAHLEARRRNEVASDGIDSPDSAEALVPAGGETETGRMYKARSSVAKGSRWRCNRCWIQTSAAAPLNGEFKISGKCSVREEESAS